MTCNVYANSMEIACKASDGKSICAMPDVCFTPPQTPATPPGVPVPYPNTALASDTTDGTTTVLIAGEEVMMRDSSCFKTSTGDEAGSAPKKGIITNQITGKAYFTAWSMDVRFEGANVPRHLDMTIHNCASTPGNALINAFIAKLKNGSEKSCGDENNDCEDCRNSSKAHAAGGLDCSDDCKKAVACCLVPKSQDKKKCCNDETTGHHLVEVHCFTATGGRSANIRLSGFGKYSDVDALCACASKDRDKGTHGVMHAVQGQIEAAFNASPDAPLKQWPGAGARSGGTRGPAFSKWVYSEARDAGVTAHKLAFPHCNPHCIKAQLDKYHKDPNGLNLQEDTPVRSDPVVHTRSCGTLTPTVQTEMTSLANKLKGISPSAAP